MKGPGHFRLAAKPSRTEGVTFERYIWRFDDGEQRKTRRPVVEHRFDGPRRRWHRVTLEVRGGDRSARTTRVLVDRTVPRRTGAARSPAEKGDAG
jgi:hypothetical protein